MAFGSLEVQIIKSCLEAGGAYPDGTSPCDTPDTTETAIIVMTHEDWRIA
jgi:hypothetical protein